MRPDGLGELLDLAGVEQQHLAMDPFRQPRSGSRVPGQPPALDPRGEHLAEYLVGVADPRR